MKKKIKKYSVFIAIIYCLLLANSINDIISSFRTGFEEGMKKANNESDSKFVALRMIPINGVYSFSQNAINTLTGEKLDIEMRECLIKVPSTINETMGFKIFSVSRNILYLFVFLVMLYIPILFFTIVKPIWQNNILNLKLMKRVKRMGWILISLYLYLFLFWGIGDLYMVSQQIVLKDYQLVSSYSNSELLILGIVTLMLGEILSHTLKMKEEQDLTI